MNLNNLSMGELWALRVLLAHPGDRPAMIEGLMRGACQDYSETTEHDREALIHLGIEPPTPGRPVVPADPEDIERAERERRRKRANTRT